MNIKKIISMVMLIVTASCGLCAYGISDSGTEEIADSKLPELKIGVDDLKPFFYTDENGDYAGIDADIATEACNRAGYKPDFVKVVWTDRDTCLEDGTVDCIWNAFVKNGREDSYLWTDSYMQSNLRIIDDGHHKEPDEGDKDKEAFGQKAGVAVRAGSKLQELFLENNENRSSIYIYSCGTFEMAETAFVKGYAAALGGHEAVLQEVIDRYPGLYQFQDGVLMTTDLAVAFSKDNTSDKYTDINDALKNMKTDGTIDDILEKYNVGLTTLEEASENEED